MRCSNCQADLTPLDSGVEPLAACPACDSTDFMISVQDRGRVVDGGTLRKKRAGLKGVLAKIWFGQRIGRDGRVVNRDALVDRENYRYRERVTTEDGEVIVDKDEDLRDHH